jgi:hypothetical protein
MGTPATKTCRLGPRLGLGPTRTRPSVKVAAGGTSLKNPLRSPEQLFGWFRTPSSFRTSSALS